MNAKYLLIAVVVVLAACDSDEQRTEYGSHEYSDSGQANGPADSRGGDFWQPLVWQEFRDQRGVVTASMPMPAGWQVSRQPGQSASSITGPNNLRIDDFPLQTFQMPHQPQMQQLYRQSGQQPRAMPGVNQLIQQDLVPALAQNGLRYRRHYEVPELSKADQWYNDQLYKAVPSRTEMSVTAVEWESDDGRSFLLLMHLSVMTTAQMQIWSYFGQTLSVDAAHYETAKKQLLFAMGNAHYPLGPIMEYNQREAQKAGQSWAAHNQRMAQNQANFEAQQRAFVNRSNAVNDAIMSGWRDRNAASDRMQERTIDSIYERTNVLDSSGQQYKVQAGSNNYWMNSDGEYIGTQYQDYNPNLDDAMNAQRWQQLQEIK